MFCLPTYEDCVEICRKNGSGKFYETISYIQGYKICVFNYRICGWGDFVRNGAFELRGLTFVFNIDGTLYKRYLLMEKFFNIGECEDVDVNSLLKNNLKSVYIKEDGSVISFIKLPNGKVISKSKVSFDSSQSKKAQNIYDTNPTIKKFVDNCLNQDLIPIFEYVGPHNQVVLKYESSELILLRLRDNFNGNYVDIEKFDIKKSKKVDLTLPQLLDLKSTTTDIEGWVVEFEDGKKVKIKTDWYLSVHKVFTEDVHKENHLINLILDEKIDDVLNYLDFGSEKREFVESVIDQTTIKFYQILDEVQNMLKDYRGNKKDFALKYSSHKYFPISIRCIGGSPEDECVRDWIKKQTKKLTDAQNWLLST